MPCRRPMPADAYDENYALLRTLRSRYIKYILRRDWPLCKTWGLEPPILRNGRKKTSVCRLSMKRQTEGGSFYAGKMKGMEHGMPEPVPSSDNRYHPEDGQPGDQSFEATSRATSIMLVNLFWRSSGVVDSPVTRESETVNSPSALTSAWGLVRLSASASTPSEA